MFFGVLDCLTGICDDAFLSDIRHCSPDLFCDKYMEKKPERA